MKHKGKYETQGQIGTEGNTLQYTIILTTDVTLQSEAEATIYQRENKNY